MTERRVRIDYVRSRPTPSARPAPSAAEASSSSSWRSTPLPSDWQAIRLRRFAIDGWRCVWIGQEGDRCAVTGNGRDGRLECDHTGAADDHSIDRLQTLCAEHHRLKTSRTTGDLNRRRMSRRRPPEPHPGLL